MDFQFKLPHINKGYYKITNFPNGLQSSDLETNTKIEFAHIIPEYVDGFKVEKIQSHIYRNHNIESLIFLKIGDNFDSDSKKLNNKVYKRSFWLENYDEIEFQTYNPSSNLEFGKESEGCQYYEFERSYESGPVTYIVPSIIIGQAFYLINSLLIKNLFCNDFGDLKDLIKWRIIQQEDLQVGEISVRKRGDQLTKALAKSLAFFLFSKDDYLWYNLINTQANLYKQILNNPNSISYNFKVPIKEKLYLETKGYYINRDGKKYFIVTEIIDITSSHNFSNLYTVDNVKFIDYTSGERNDNVNNDNTGKGKRFKPGNKNKNTTVTNDDKNPNLSKNFIESGLNLLNKIVQISIEYKLSEKASSGTPIINPISDYGTFNTKNPNPDSPGAETSGSKEDKTNNKIGKDKIFFMLHSVVENLKATYSCEEFINKNTDLIIFTITDLSNRSLLLIDDAFHERIQLVHKSTLENFTHDEINNFIIIITNNNYNWKKIRELEKKSDGLLFSSPTNYNNGGTRLEKKTKREDGTVEEKRVSDLCYRNILDKITKLFV
ncbi:hypothetical protein KB553_16420 [Chryseobacterium rhizoplanae]|uniref:hypothetical protein n=1 Tax=Chryseobacterium rhizoplanae TaxID=1609531 RepID=UPI001CE390F0|nr:hypothetical protein [Chryseobacterium rhizoplanae]UCA58624.1 hypothetical protein KB553_16420 [Chryseobacterium rhizoplanae]